MSKQEIPITPASSSASDAILLFRELMSHRPESDAPVCNNNPVETQRRFYMPVRGDRVRVVAGDYGLPIPPSLNVGQVYEFFDASCWWVPDANNPVGKSIFAAMVKIPDINDTVNPGGILVALGNLEPV